MERSFDLRYENETTETVNSLPVLVSMHTLDTLVFLLVKAPYKTYLVITAVLSCTEEPSPIEELKTPHVNKGFKNNKIMAARRHTYKLKGYGNGTTLP